jgi:hypothetical protein
MWRDYPNRARQWVKLHERRLSSLALFGGFIVDSFTLRRIDLWFENAVLGSYLLLAGGGLVLLNLHDQQVWRGRVITWLRPWLGVLVQFAFGGLFSGFTIFYYRSGTLAASWPVLLLLLGLLIGNERFRERYARLVFQVSIFFTALFFFNIFYLPVLLGRMGPGIFLLSGFFSLFLIWAFSRLLFRLAPALAASGGWRLRAGVLGIFLLINLFYFTNILPPIPLSLKEGGIYQRVSRNENGLIGVGPKLSWREWLRFYPAIAPGPGGELAAYSAVFAPTRLTTNIVHHWRRYDEVAGAWISQSRVTFPIVGGRDGGYRGYSTKSQVAPGRWRVDVETPRGQLIGRIKFSVNDAKTSGIIQVKEL